MMVKRAPNRGEYVCWQHDRAEVGKRVQIEKGEKLMCRTCESAFMQAEEFPGAK